MNKDDLNYFYLLLSHVLLGFAIFYIKPMSLLYSAIIVLSAFIYILKTRNSNNQVLYVAAYIVGSEVFLRMTQGTISYEFSKYGVIICMLVGMYYSGFSKYATPFWIYLLFLIPGIIVATQGVDFKTDLRRAVIFNISGPLCLGISALYCYSRQITFEQLNKVLLSLGLPIISMTVYVFLYNPSVKEVVTGTASNIQTSGGFGPNQVATILGLGIFVFFNRILFFSSSKFQLILNAIILVLISYRGLSTFSRGGIITGVLMIIVLLILVYARSNNAIRLRLIYLIVLLIFSSIIVWTYTSNQTGGMINKRYANQDAAGREKEDKFTGRSELFEDEWNNFLNNPVLGIGVGKSVMVRTSKSKEFVVSHSEISRTLSEHGAFGILALIIVFVTPLLLYLVNKNNIYIFSLVLFWILTINHAAMRIAAPSFVYALSLLKVINHEKIIIHRK